MLLIYRSGLYAFCILLLTLSAFSLSAQELLLPIKRHTNLKPGNSNQVEKGFKRNFDKTCQGTLPFNPMVTAFAQPSACLEDDGSITVTIENGVPPFTYSLTSPIGINQTSGITDATSYTFSNLPSGPYFLTLSDNIGNNQTLRFELDDINIAPIQRQNWEAIKKNVFCNSLGSIRKIFVTDVSINYRLYDMNDDLVHNYVTDGVLASNLLPGLYYLRSNKQGEKCYSYYIIEIFEEPTISLPFTEDFSTSLVYPDPAVWIDDRALINDTYAINPPSIGVATLDGLNQFGNPYMPVPSGSALIDGIGDVLTSRPICLGDLGLGAGDTVFFRFFYQAEGFGDFPNIGDSLVFEAYVPRVRDSMFSVTTSGTGYHVKYDDDANNSGIEIDIDITVPTANMISYHPDTHVFYIDQAGNAIYLDFTNPSATLTYVNDTIFPIIQNFTVQVQDTTWVPQWGIDGFTASQTPDFAAAVVKIGNPDVFFNGFRFRFRNRATVSGNNDHWNIDYVQASTDLPANYPQLQDVAFVYQAPPMLNRYQAMPWSHFYPYMDKELASAADVPIKIRNNDIGFANRTLTHTLSDVCSQTQLYNYEAGTADVLGSIQGIVTSQAVFIKDDIAQSLTNNSTVFNGEDTIILENRWNLSVSAGSLELNFNNDTIYQYQQFANYFAHDDGTAERAYGLYGTGAQLAYQFVLNHPDTLRALQINFINMNSNVFNHEFKIRVWKKLNVDIETGLPLETPIPDELVYQEDAINMPRYLNQINGFWTYRLQTPLAITDTIYVGIEQRFENQLNIGYDRNTNASGKLFYNSSGQWLGSIYAGSLMLRPVVGAALPQGNLNVGIQPNTAPSITNLLLYPNPTTDMLYMELPHNLQNQTSSAPYIQVFDLLGKQVIAGYLNNQAVSTAHLPAGMYVLHLYNQQMEPQGIGKFLKQ